ncbi:MAG: hypothetical protein IJH60_06945 [Eubacterium sp.]|nr:hypothetical protein [Eubacterium sp.]
MPGWLAEFLAGSGIQIAAGIWNASMKLVSGILTKSPQDFSTPVWTFVDGTLYPWALSIGLSLLNLFLIIGWLRALTRLHENITLEMTVNALIKLVAANVLLVNIKTIITSLFSTATLMAGSIFTLQPPALVAEDLDLGAILFYNLFGILYILAAIVCSFIILLTVYSRYIRLYLLVVSAPFAIPSIVGGEEARRTFISWMKTFILNTFEIVMIALVMVISFKLISGGINLFEQSNVAVEAVNGFFDALNGLFTMVLMTASVKGVNSFMTKAFGL